MPNPFPPLNRELRRPREEDSNPAIQLFGRRFFSDQTVPEFLIELLLVATSRKKVMDQGWAEDDYFPDLAFLKNWPAGGHLAYAPKSRLNLKLFALLGASKIQTRHKTHRDHYKRLLQALKDHIEDAGGIGKDNILKTLENLFLGFQRVGGQRTWCAQSFLPIRPEMIAGETIWKETKARREKPDTWEELISDGKFFVTSQHIFLSRGGEALYLQLCNALRTPQEKIDHWVRQNAFSYAEEESLQTSLYQALSQHLKLALDDCPITVGKLARFIDETVEPDTARNTDTRDENARYTLCGWCPEETWPESHLFAIELLRLCQATIDPIERIMLLETACAMQVLRTLCAQSARYDETYDSKAAGPLGYVWVVSDPDGNHGLLKNISRRSLQANLLQIQKALRHSEIQDNVDAQDNFASIKGQFFTDPYKEADRRYGHKLFLSVAKRLGFVVPRRGPGARFVLTDHLLRYLVLTIIRPGERMTYDSFVEQVFQRYGIAFNGKYSCRACDWCGVHQPTNLGSETEQWVMHMLEEAGVMVHLSDACSMIENPFGKEGVVD